MRLHSLLRFNFAKSSLFILLTILLVGCGSNLSAPVIGNATSTIAQNGPFFPNTAFDISGLLHIEGQIDCSPIQATPLPKALVLATNRLNYDSGEIQQMEAYLDDPLPNKLPVTLQLVSGRPPEQIPINGQVSSSTPYASTCGGILNFTNIGQTSIQLSQINMRLIADTQPNNYRYHLIDVCSVGPGHTRAPANPYYCAPTGGGGAPVTYTFSLRKGGENTVFQGQYTDENGNSSAGPTIAQGQTVNANMEFTTLASSNLIYSMTPELVLDTPGKQTSIELSQLTSTLAFADTDRFSCYQLPSGETTFVHMSSIVRDPSHALCA